MRYILNPYIALRSWMLVPYAYYLKGERNAKGLTAEEFAFLSECDGRSELPDEAESPLARASSRAVQSQRSICVDNACENFMSWPPFGWYGTSIAYFVPLVQVFPKSHCRNGNFSRKSQEI